MTICFALQYEKCPLGSSECAQECLLDGERGGIVRERADDGELAPVTRERFAARLRGLGLDPADYLLLPVHPWQWVNKLAVTFAPDVARRDLVHLGAVLLGFVARGDAALRA